MYSGGGKGNGGVKHGMWSSYGRQIKSAESRSDVGEVDRVRGEYEAQQKAWRAQQGLEKIAPRQISAAKKEPSLTEEEVEQLMLGIKTQER